MLFIGEEDEENEHLKKKKQQTISSDQINAHENLYSENFIVCSVAI